MSNQINRLLDWWHQQPWQMQLLTCPLAFGLTARNLALAIPPILRSTLVPPTSDDVRLMTPVELHDWGRRLASYYANTTSRGAPHLLGKRNPRCRCDQRTDAGETAKFPGTQAIG